MKKHVLIVDDEVYFRYTAGNVLKENGYRISEAVNGKDALKMILDAKGGRETYDLLMTDILMPGMSGMELIRELKNNDISMPVLVSTGLVEKRLFKGQLRKGCLDYIEKPFEPDDFVAKVGTILQ